MEGNFEISVGCFLDYFQNDCDIVALDSSYLVNLSYDEGVLLLGFFNLCAKCLPGTYIILISYTDKISLKDFSIDFFVEVFRTVLDHTCTRRSSLYLYKVKSLI